jgi:hypothetical protein
MTNTESKKIITEQKERIAILEFHLGKLRDLLWLGYTNTSGIQTAPSPTKQRTPA